MSEATSLTDGGPSYSLFFEIAMAVGTTIVAMFLCQKRRHEGSITAVESEKGGTKNDSKKAKIEDNDITEAQKDGSMMQDVPHVGGKTTSVPNNKTFTSTTTQTDLPPIEERITWKAIIVNPLESPALRYRSELYVNVDGVVSHSEMIQKEGIVGAGMKQILAKVQ